MQSRAIRTPVSLPYTYHPHCYFWLFTEHRNALQASYCLATELDFPQVVHRLSFPPAE